MAGLLITILVTLGLLLFIVPGLFLFARFHLFPFRAVDKGGGAIDSVKQNFKMTKGHAWKIWLYLLVALSLSILVAAIFGAVPILVDVMGSLLSLPLVIAGAALYRWIGAHQIVEAKR